MLLGRAFTHRVWIPNKFTIKLRITDIDYCVKKIEGWIYTITYDKNYFFVFQFYLFEFYRDGGCILVIKTNNIKINK